MATSLALFGIIAFALVLGVGNAVVLALSIQRLRRHSGSILFLRSSLKSLRQLVTKSGLDPSLGNEVAALAEGLAVLQALHRSHTGKVWQRIGALERGERQFVNDETNTDTDLDFRGDDQARRDELRRRLLPKSMAGKITALRAGLAQGEEHE